MNYTTPTLIELTERERDLVLDWAVFAYEQLEHVCPLRDEPMKSVKAIRNRLQSGGVHITLNQWCLFQESNPPSILAQFNQRAA